MGLNDSRRMSHEGQKPAVRSRRIALAALLALACSQLVFAGHHFEHDASGVDEVCAACLQLEQFDNPSFVAAKPAAAAQTVELAKARLTALVELTESAPYSTRAPPSL